MVLPAYIKPVLALLVIAAIAAIAAAVFRDGSGETTAVRPSVQSLPRNIDVSLKRARFSELQDGVVKWELFAEQADYGKASEVAYLSDIKMEFQHTGSHGAVTVTANKGQYATASRDVLLTGDINAVTEDGAHFSTDSLLFSGAAALFSTADPVTFRQQRLQLTATGMDFGVDNQLARFRSSVAASIMVN
ncbi:MAG: LPS export ABC transporter periplasmic protein LptC [Desulfuromonadaceae bacterium]|nr:LPS export ABC transporter periplasmic protein LptC [Desulfuromonadaceae bacterium]MDD5105292.1 LPS export ABC transporter periplasmic protein LptC [Desulfuromonadaceae bacterium]